jgi:hypothetical protein
LVSHRHPLGALQLTPEFGPNQEAKECSINVSNVLRLFLAKGRTGLQFASLVAGLGVAGAAAAVLDRAEGGASARPPVMQLDRPASVPARVQPPTTIYIVDSQASAAAIRMAGEHATGPISVLVAESHEDEFYIELAQSEHVHGVLQGVSIIDLRKP